MPDLASVVPRPAATSMSIDNVLAILDSLCGELGYPASVRINRGREFIPRDLDRWAYMRGATLDFSRPGAPTDNVFIESFDGRLRAECPNVHWFVSLDDAVGKCETWRIDYNEVRPPGEIGDKPPMSLVTVSGT